MYGCDELFDSQREFDSTLELSHKTLLEWSQPFTTEPFTILGVGVVIGLQDKFARNRGCDPLGQVSAFLPADTFAPQLFQFVTELLNTA